MHFTREPVVETVITPREGSKLVVRSSKGLEQEDYYVDAVEIVSFGQALFFRSKERPKSFLVPVSDYEVIELKETRMVLKTAGIEKSIKIGGGKDNSLKQDEVKGDKKRDKRRSSRKRKNSSNEKDKGKIKKNEPPIQGDEVMPSSSVIRKLFPPPPTLIKEKLLRAKDKETFTEEIVPGEEIDQEEFVIEENSVSFTSKNFSEDFQKNMSDPEILEEPNLKKEEKKELTKTLEEKKEEKSSVEKEIN